MSELWPIVNSIGDALIATDAQGKMTFYNPAAKDLLGVELSQDKPEVWPDHFGVYLEDKVTRFPTEKLPLVVALKGADTNGVIQFIRNKNRPDGVFISVTGRPIRDATSKITGAVVVIRDISELKKAEAELEAFSYSVSHDLRTPLRSIIGFSDILLKKHSQNLNSEGLDYLNRVKNSGDKLGQLIDGLLDLSRLTRRDIRKEKINLSNIAKFVVADLKSQEPDRDVSIKIEEGISVVADERLLQSVLLNLIGNSWKFTSRTPAAKIEFGVLDRAAAQQTFFVKDNGAGFNPEYAKKLFNIFQRLHSNTEFAGNGIGLATVQRIIRRHGGTIWAEGKQGEGAVFYFTLKQIEVTHE